MSAQGVKGGERERESPFTVLDADGPDKFKGSAEFLCVAPNRRQIDNDCNQLLLKPSPKKSARRIGGIHRATSSGLGEPEDPSRE